MSKKKDKMEEGKIEKEQSDWEEMELEEEGSGDKKTLQNYLAAIILLIGLFAGSIFVDVAGLIKGEGISLKRLEGKDIFSYGGKTWVASNNPVVPLTIVNDENCKECNVDNAVLGLKSAIPTIVPKEISTNSEEGKKILEKAASKMIPVFVFDKAIEKTDIFDKIQGVLTQKDDMYILDSSALGISGKYTSTPPFESKNQEALGSPEAKVSIITFSDFQCPYSKAFYESLDKLLKEDDYKNKVRVSFKHLPLSFHSKSNDAAMASLCAGEQGKFWDMYNTLFSKQNEWSSAKDNEKFKSYAASLKLDTQKFNQCLDSKKFQNEIDADKELAKEYSINGTPGIFINDEFVSGAIGYEELKSKVDTLLNK